MILYIKQTDFSLKTAVILLIFNTRVIVMKISILDYVIVQKISKIKHEYQIEHPLPLSIRNFPIDFWTWQEASTLLYRYDTQIRNSANKLREPIFCDLCW